MRTRGMGFPTAGVENHGWKLYITSLVMIILAGLIVIARCASRFYFHKFGWDDTFIALSLAFSIVLSVTIQLAIENGYGMHKADLTKEELRTALKFFFIAQTPYKVVICLNKVAAILLYMRIFVTTKFYIASYLVMGIVVAWSIGSTTATIWQCVPIAGAWDKSIQATCINSNVFWVAYAVMNVVTDVMVLVLPIPPILSLYLGTRQKIMLCCIFLMGGFVTVTSILRATVVKDSIENKADITWNFINRSIWTLIEANLGIISACLPVLKQPLARLFPRIFGSTLKGSSYYTDKKNRSEGAFNLSNLPAQESHPAMWRGTIRSRQVISISGPETPTRKSDEQLIIGDFLKDSDGGSARQGLRGISKTVEVVRTSFHEDER